MGNFFLQKKRKFIKKITLFENRKIINCKKLLLKNRAKTIKAADYTVIHYIQIDYSSHYVLNYAFTRSIILTTARKISEKNLGIEKSGRARKISGKIQPGKSRKKNFRIAPGFGV